MGNVGVWKAVATNESVIWSAALFRRFCFLRRQKGRKSSEAEVVVELRVEGKTKAAEKRRTPNKSREACVSQGGTWVYGKRLHPVDLSQDSRNAHLGGPAR